MIVEQRTYIKLDNVLKYKYSVLITNEIKLRIKIFLLQIPFTKDCGAKNKCISDLVLNVKASIAGDR